MKSITWGVVLCSPESNSRRTLLNNKQSDWCAAFWIVFGDWSTCHHLLFFHLKNLSNAKCSLWPGKILYIACMLMCQWCERWWAMTINFNQCVSWTCLPIVMQDTLTIHSVVNITPPAGIRFCSLLARTLLRYRQVRDWTYSMILIIALASWQLPVTNLYFLKPSYQEKNDW